MIYVKSFLKIIDNTGTKKVQCIKVYNKNFANIGDIILVSIKLIKKKKTKKKIIIEKSNKFKIIIIRTRKKTINKYRWFVKFYENSGILLNNKLEPVGNKILGPVPSKLRNKKLFKLILITTFIV